MTYEKACWVYQQPPDLVAQQAAAQARLNAIQAHREQEWAIVMVQAQWMFDLANQARDQE